MVLAQVVRAYASFVLGCHPYRHGQLYQVLGMIAGSRAWNRKGRMGMQLVFMLSLRRCLPRRAGRRVENRPGEGAPAPSS